MTRWPASSRARSPTETASPPAAVAFCSAVRSPQSAAAALRLVHPTATALKPPQLTTWLKQRADTSGDDRRTNAQVHEVNAGSLKLINEALAKPPVGTEAKAPKIDEKDEKPTPRRGGKTPEVKTVEFPHGGKHRPAFTNRRSLSPSSVFEGHSMELDPVDEGVLVDRPSVRGAVS